MGPFWTLALGMLFVWLISSGVLSKLLAAITGANTSTPGPTVTSPGVQLPPGLPPTIG